MKRALKRRLTTIALAFVAAAGLAASQHAQAAPGVDGTTSTWACAAVKDVAGTCVENPFQGIEDKGGLVGIAKHTLQGK